MKGVIMKPMGIDEDVYILAQAQEIQIDKKRLIAAKKRIITLSDQENKFQEVSDACKLMIAWEIMEDIPRLKVATKRLEMMYKDVVKQVTNLKKVTKKKVKKKR